jgi:hypothetical protein
VRVTDHAGHAGKRCDLLRRALRITPRDNNLCQRILTLHAADGGAGILIRGIRDSASIQNDKIGLARWGRRQTTGFELAFESSAIGLSGAASKILYVVGGHGAMVTQTRISRRSASARFYFRAASTHGHVR